MVIERTQFDEMAVKNLTCRGIGAKVVAYLAGYPSLAFTRDDIMAKLELNISSVVMARLVKKGLLLRKGIFYAIAGSV